MTMKEKGNKSRTEMLAELVGNTYWAYAPCFYEPEYHADGTIAAVPPHAFRCSARDPGRHH